MKKLFLIIVLITSFNIYSEINIAISGYDTVSYFTESKAVKGDKNIFYDLDNTRWFFKTVEHRDLFISTPDIYKPYFGELCANGLSDGHVITANPKYWLIDKDRLFLFYSRRGRNSWTKDNIEIEFKKAVEYLKSITN